MGHPVRVNINYNKCVFFSCHDIRRKDLLHVLLLYYAQQTSRKSDTHIEQCLRFRKVPK